VIQYINWDENGLLTLVSDQGKIIFTNEDTCMVNKYGDTFTINSLKATFKQNAPTYDELYEYWLKTKQND
jgi:hypothetical protein